MPVDIWMASDPDAARVEEMSGGLEGNMGGGGINAHVKFRPVVSTLQETTYGAGEHPMECQTSSVYVTVAAGYFRLQNSILMRAGGTIRVTRVQFDKPSP